MSDIEYLEEYIRLCKATGMDKTKAQAIENILEENKRLKAKIDVTDWQEKSCYKILNERYIPKSLLRAMLEKREKEYNSHDDWHKKYMDTQLKIEIRILKEILGLED